MPLLETVKTFYYWGICNSLQIIFRYTSKSRPS